MTMMMMMWRSALAILGARNERSSLHDYSAEWRIDWHISRDHGFLDIKTVRPIRVS